MQKKTIENVNKVIYLGNKWKENNKNKEHTKYFMKKMNKILDKIYGITKRWFWEDTRKKMRIFQGVL